MNHGCSGMQVKSDFRLNLLKVLNSLSFVCIINFTKDFITLNSHINLPVKKYV